jgi:hypothetical protein
MPKLTIKERIAAGIVGACLGTIIGPITLPMSQLHRVFSVVKHNLRGFMDGLMFTLVAPLAVPLIIIWLAVGAAVGSVIGGVRGIMRGAREGFAGLKTLPRDMASSPEALLADAKEADLLKGDFLSTSISYEPIKIRLKENSNEQIKMYNRINAASFFTPYKRLKKTDIETLLLAATSNERVGNDTPLSTLPREVIGQIFEYLPDKEKHPIYPNFIINET